MFGHVSFCSKAGSSIASQCVRLSDAVPPAWDQMSRIMIINGSSAREADLNMLRVKMKNRSQGLSLIPSKLKPQFVISAFVAFLSSLS